VRGFLDASLERPIGAHRFVSRTTFAAAHAMDQSLTPPSVPAQELIYLGGPVSGPGYDYHEFVGEIGGSQRLEWRAPMPFIPIPLGRFGTSPARMTLAPFAHTVYLAKSRSAERATGWYPALGVGALLFFDALRFDAGYGLRDGRWTFNVDLTPELWRVL
jgi:hypothetical protein